MEDFDFAAQSIVSKDEFFLAFVSFEKFSVELGEQGKTNLVVADCYRLSGPLTGMKGMS